MPAHMTMSQVGHSSLRVPHATRDHMSTGMLQADDRVCSSALQALASVAEATQYLLRNWLLLCSYAMAS